MEVGKYIPYSYDVLHISIWRVYLPNRKKRTANQNLVEQINLAYYMERGFRHHRSSMCILAPVETGHRIDLMLKETSKIKMVI